MRPIPSWQDPGESLHPLPELPPGPRERGGSRGLLLAACVLAALASVACVLVLLQAAWLR